MSVRSCSILFGLVPAFLLPGCGKPGDPWDKVPGGNIKILVSFPPLYCFAKQVAGPHAKVLCLATSVGPHHYEPTPADALKAIKADRILYNGLGLDDEKILRLASSGKNAKVVALAKEAKGIKILNMKGQDHGDHVHKAGPDPHVWLGLDEAKAMVEHLSAVLQDLDPENKEAYRKRTKAYVGQLDALKKYGTKLLTGKKGQIITMHAALNYFARTFQIKIADSIQIQPGIEADATKLANLVDYCQKHQDTDEPVRAITTEPQYPSGAAQTLRDELVLRNVQVALVDFDTLETADPAKLRELDPDNPATDFYLTKMRANIEILAEKMP